VAHWTKPSRSNRLLMAGGPPRQWKQKELGRAPAVLQYMYCRMGATSGVLRALLDLKRAWQGRAVSVGTPRPPSWDATIFYYHTRGSKQLAGRPDSHSRLLILSDVMCDSASPPHHLRRRYSPHVLASSPPPPL